MRNIIYQIALRTFTPAGTLSAATERLAHVASLGVDLVYVCPFFVEENDENRDTWSKRQLASQTDNPKNPYKIADYFHVDEEFGTEADVVAFVAEAHRLGMRVLFDLVYLHCARNPAFLNEHPDFVVRNPDGTVLIPDRWPFARLNFESRGLREHLIRNMEWLVEDMGADGFRCDVGDSVPLDFWREAFAYLKVKHPSLITLNEGREPTYLDGVFDWNYSFPWRSTVRSVFGRDGSAADIRALYAQEQDKYSGRTDRLTRALDTHDTASDVGLLRNEILFTTPGMEAALVLQMTTEGVPFVWNGTELCDKEENNMFSNRFHGRRSAMDWSSAFTADGARRMSVFRALTALRRKHAALSEGSTRWSDNSAPDEVVSYVRQHGEEAILVVINAKNKPVNVAVDVLSEFSETIMSSGARVCDNTATFEAYGYLILKKKSTSD